MSEGPLLCEYFLQRGQNIGEGLGIDCANPLDQSDPVNRSDLIEHDQALFRCVRHGYAEGRQEALAGHRSDNDCAQMLVKFRRRDDDARPRLFDITSDRWVKSDEPDLAAFYHSSYRSAALAKSPMRSTSSP